jgi:hypothetical protein
VAEPLSPQAQAVLDAAFSAYWSAEQEAPNDEGMIAAAALRAAADQLRNAYANEEYIDSADDFLDAIAAELENTMEPIDG